jgi:NRPS condensation-like uncharacterized protein
MYKRKYFKRKILDQFMTIHNILVTKQHHVTMLNNKFNHDKLKYLLYQIKLKTIIYKREYYKSINAIFQIPDTTAISTLIEHY